MTPQSASRGKKKPFAKKRAPSAPRSIAMTSWTRQEQGLMPALLALMTRTLPGVLAEHRDADLADGSVLCQIIEKADARLLEHLDSLGQVPPEKRLRYWRALLAAMIEDRVVTVRPHRRKASA